MMYVITIIHQMRLLKFLSVKCVEKSLDCFNAKSNFRNDSSVEILVSLLASRYVVRRAYHYLDFIRIWK